MKMIHAPALAKWLTSLALVAVATAISYIWLDRGIAYFAHDELRQFAVFPHLTRISEGFATVAVAAIAIVGLRALSGRPLSKLHSVTLLSGLSLLVATAAKNQLKFVFGRTWPETWIHNNPSLIHDGVYGFNPFHGGAGFSSFPSGHTAAVCAVMSVLWICYPQWRALYALCVAAVVAGLIGADYHFLSDIIAGGFVGASTGWMAVALWEAVGAPSVSAATERRGPASDPAFDQPTHLTAAEPRPVKLPV